jgi:hypothetical protein
MPQNAGYALDIANIGAFIYNGTQLATTTNNRCVHLSPKIDDFSGYMIPTEVNISWKGTTNEDTPRPIEIDSIIKLDTLRDKIDVLGELPFLLRKFLQVYCYSLAKKEFELIFI